ncbi:CHAP domain-containing protein, partial [Kitasatospora sp. NPDC059648]|uniref:CHAP domain-containing protein n=1 Tax=Kitasatospora sp. NPDC059648 TaxID=3346894 RepID=UPI003677194D
MTTLVSRAFQKSAVGAFIAAVVISGVSAPSAYATTAPITAAVGGQTHGTSAHSLALTLDNVALQVSSSDLPSGQPYIAAPGSGVQVASLSENKPFRYFSVTAVPFGEELSGSDFPVSAVGGTAAWVKALNGTQNGPVATIFGQKAKGVVVHSQGNLTGKKADHTDIQTITWIVEQGSRTWVVNLQHDEASLPGNFGANLVIASGDTSARTSVDLAKVTAAPTAATGRMPANAVGLGGSLGQPSWWNSTCDGNGNLLNTQFMGLQVCANGGNRLEYVPGVAQYEWQCAELSDRYLVQRYGVDGAGGNGNQEAQNWYNKYPSMFQLHGNGDHASPVPGDVISFAVGSSRPGHTGVVHKSSVDSSGNGTVYFVDENWTGDGGYNSASVSNWNVAEITGEGGSVQWLHNPADNSAPAATSTSPVSFDATGYHIAFVDPNGNLANDWVANGVW